MAAFLTALYFYTFLVGFSISVDIKRQDPHAPFPDLDESLYRESKHKIFTKDELSIFNGNKPGLPIYVAVKGIVFDVSSEKDLYGAGQSYNSLTGKDASRAIAKWSLAAENMNNNLEGLTKEELNRLEENFHNVYMKKYLVAGYMQGYEPKVEENLTWQREEL